MQHLFSLKVFIFLPLILLFLPAFCVPGGSLSSFLPIYNIALVLFIIVFGLFKFKTIVNTIYSLGKNTSFKYLILYIMWCLISVLFFAVTGRLSLSKSIYSILVIIIGYYTLYSIYPAILTKFLNIRNIYKIITLALFLILVWGIISYLGTLLHIAPIEVIELLISNKNNLMIGMQQELHMRNHSVFTEPSVYGYFLVTNLWFIYSIAESKYKIFYNTYLNSIIKISIVPLTIINIITTFSPVTIVIFFIITTIYLLQHKSIIKRSLVILVIMLSFIIYSLPTVQETKTVSRIQNTISSFTDFEKFAVAEASLYTRICSFINTFHVFLKHPIAGVGSGMTKYYMAEQFKNSPVPLSAENRGKMISAKQGGVVGFNLAILYTTLSDNGFIGFILLYTYFIGTVLSLRKIKHYYNKANFEFINFIIPTMWSMIILSVYDSFLINSPYLFLIFIIANSICLKQQKKLAILQEYRCQHSQS